MIRQVFPRIVNVFLFLVKPINYGAFGSYAPSYDSTFANLTKEESDLVYQTYGDETSVQYAERYVNINMAIIANREKLHHSFIFFAIVSKLALNFISLSSNSLS